VRSSQQRGGVLVISHEDVEDFKRDFWEDMNMDGTYLDSHLALQVVQNETMNTGVVNDDNGERDE
jgi:hypothetical protein